MPLDVPFSEKKFSTLIAGNKSVKSKGELYSERLRAIRFMEQNYLSDFDLYSVFGISPSISDIPTRR